MNPFHPGRTIEPNPVASARVVGTLCALAGIDVQETFPRDEVVLLLRNAGYNVTPGTVAEFIRKGYIGEPENDEWTAQHIHALCASLESRRRWKPFPAPLHDFKKSVVRIQIEQAAANGIADPIHDLDTISLEDLLIQIAENDSRGIRETLYEAIKLKLAEVGFVEE